MSEDRSPPRLSKPELVAARLILALPLVVLVVPLFSLSENLHSVGESTTYDRIALAIRTFWGQSSETASGLSAWNIDHNFPLGTAFIFALPVALGLDPVSPLRLHSALWALLTTVALYRLFRPQLRPITAALSATAPWWVPAFARGSVVSGEEAPTVGLMLVGLLALAHARDRPRALILSCLAVNGMVLFRLDAMFIPPFFALAGLWVVGGRRAILYAVGCAGTTLLHLGTTWLLTGDPLDFARVATRVTGSIATKASVSPLDFLTATASYLGGWPILVLALLGLLALLRNPSTVHKLFLGLFAWLAFGYTLAVGVPVLEVDIPRYFVPFLTLLAAAVPLAALWLPRRKYLREGAAGAALLLLALLNLGTIKAQAQEARLEPGLLEASSWLHTCAPGLRTLSTHRAPALQLAAGHRTEPVHLLNSRWNTSNPRPMGEELNAKGAEVLVLVGSGPEVQEFRASKIRDWLYVWQDKQVVIYSRVSPSQRERLLSCRK